MNVVANGILVGRRLTCSECGCVFEIGPDDAPDALAVGIGCPDLAVFECPQCLQPCLTTVVPAGKED